MCISKPNTNTYCNIIALLPSAKPIRTHACSCKFLSPHSSAHCKDFLAASLAFWKLDSTRKQLPISWNNADESLADLQRGAFIVSLWKNKIHDNMAHFTNVQRIHLQISNSRRFWSELTWLRNAYVSYFVVFLCINWYFHLIKHLKIYWYFFFYQWSKPYHRITFVSSGEKKIRSDAW